MRGQVGPGPNWSPTTRSSAPHRAIAHSGYAEIDAGHVAFFEKEDEPVTLVEEFTRATTP
ncbi:hypothetical protein [Streptomyces profundus]|uniref:hypothetical protein n=1 Tax=Streptomyces profundus TaxID=2867410 RepID=UPI001D169D65|nr:hypothetical protein [Streptomyces sp. MA3_2.13]